MNLNLETWSKTSLSSSDDDGDDDTSLTYNFKQSGVEKEQNVTTGKTNLVEEDEPDDFKEDEDNDENRDSAISFYKKEHRMHRMSLTRRRIVSGFQWSCKGLLYVLAIMALIDIGIAPSSNNYYIYLNQQTALAAGYPFHGTIYGGPWPYFIIQTVSFGLMCAAFFIEWRSYSVRMMGVDVKWDVMPIFLLSDKYVINSIKQAKYSLTPFGAAYDNYVYFMLFQAMLFFLVFFHIFIEGWDMIFFCVLYVVFGFWSFIIDIFYMTKLFFFSNHEFNRYIDQKNMYIELKQKEKDKFDAAVRIAAEKMIAEKTIS